MNEISTEKSIVEQKNLLLNQYDTLTEDKLNQLIKNVFKEKLINIQDEYIIKQLDQLERIIKFQLNALQSKKRDYFTLANLIFLPLGFIVGFFGMNFRSMGTPSLKTGILTIPHGEKFVFSISLLSSLLISVYYYIVLK